MENKITDTFNVSANITKLWEQSRLRITDEFKTPPVILRVDESIIGTLGNFSASTGKAKSKKTFNICAIVAAALTNDTVLNYTASFPDEKRKSLYIPLPTGTETHPVTGRIANRHTTRNAGISLFV